MSIKTIVHGAGGHIGQIVCQLVLDSKELELAAAVDAFRGTVKADGRNILTSLDEYPKEADVVIDFSHHTCCPDLMAYCSRNALPGRQIGRASCRERV